MPLTNTMKIIIGGIYKNIKTQNEYSVLDIVHDVTNHRAMSPMVLYRQVQELKGAKYVRDLEEFKEKFEQKL